MDPSKVIGTLLVATAVAGATVLLTDTAPPPSTAATYEVPVPISMLVFDADGGYLWAPQYGDGGVLLNPPPNSIWSLDGGLLLTPKWADGGWTLVDAGAN